MSLQVIWRTSWSLAVSLLVLGSLLAVPIYGQGERATVTGTVMDSSRAIVVGAKVSIRNIQTNVVTQTTTNSAGIYYLPALPPGRYELKVDQTGFRPAIVADIPLGAAFTATFNVTLEVGTVTQAVEVQATAVQLEAQTTGLGKILQNQSIAELPVVARDPTSLLSLLPGVQPQAGAALSTGIMAKMSGGTAIQNSLLTDGGQSSGFSTRSAAIVPLESVQEVRVDTTTYASEFGRSGGGVINVVTKSGTNQFHGVGYEFLQNDHLNANSWQNNRSKVTRGLYQNNLYGAAIGGPIIRDRTFFFFNYEAGRQGTPLQFLGTVPTALQKLGDFTQTLNGTGQPIITYDPVTTRSDPARPGQYIRDPFPDNTIPQPRINPVSSNVLKYWPDANRPGEGPAAFNNYFKAAKSINHTDTWLLRIDHVISDKHRLFGRFDGRQARSFTSGLGVEDVALISSNISSTPIRDGLVSFTSTFSPSLLGELRLSYVRLQSQSEWDGKGFDIASLGFPSSLVKAIRYNTFPNISVSQYTSGTGLSVSRGTSLEVDSISGGNKSLSPSDNWQLQYHLTWLQNRHKIKFGTDLQLIRLNSATTNSPAGAYFFDRLYTQGPNPLRPVQRPGAVLPASFSGFLSPIASVLIPPLWPQEDIMHSMFRTTFN